MTEEPTEYKVDSEVYPFGDEIEKLHQAAYLRHPEIFDKLKAMDDDPVFKRSRLLKSPYYQEVADTARAMIASGWGNEVDEIVENAIALTDKLIEKLGEKS